LHVELLAGNKPQPSLPDAIAKCLVIIDTGCGRSMGNHPLQFKAGSIRKKVTTATGAHGSFKTMFEGTLAMPMQTESRGICMYGERDAVLHEACPYALWSPGCASIKRGVSLSMPAWGNDGFVEFTSGIRVSFVNQHVLVLRPLGYKASPRAALALLGAPRSSPVVAPAQASTPASLPASVPALTLIHGKTIARAGVTAELLHRISGHLPGAI